MCHNRVCYYRFCYFFGWIHLSYFGAAALPQYFLQDRVVGNSEVELGSWFSFLTCHFEHFVAIGAACYIDLVLHPLFCEHINVPFKEQTFAHGHNYVPVENTLDPIQKLDVYEVVESHHYYQLREEVVDAED